MKERLQARWRKPFSSTQMLQELQRRDTCAIGHGIEGAMSSRGKSIRGADCGLGGVAEFKEVREDLIQEGIKRFGKATRAITIPTAPLAGHLPGTGGGRSPVFNGHVDSMPYGERNLWSFDPFSGNEVDGVIQGLGATDMKGGLVAALAAIDLVRSARFKLKGDVFYQSVVDEEGGGNGTLALVMDGFKADAAVVCEFTDLNVQIGHVGWVFYKFSLLGRAIHSGRKWEGESAIEYAIVDRPPL